MSSTDPEELLPIASSPAPHTPPPIQTKKPSDHTAAAAIQSPPADNDEEECRTPTAPENRIPEPLICPPAPRKPASTDFYCKRKKTRENFYELVHPEEVESFFNESNSDFNSTTPLRKRRIIA